jgi:hypothetical protein
MLNELFKTAMTEVEGCGQRGHQAHASHSPQDLQNLNAFMDTSCKAGRHAHENAAEEKL